MQCISPISIERPNGRGRRDRVIVPCSKCYHCISNKRADWVLRLTEEWKGNISAFFVTLTYNDYFLPYKENGNATLKQIDLVNFIKRLRYYIDQDERSERKIYQGKKLKYFGVGEYGPQTIRPHYHLLMFNLPSYAIGEMLFKAWQDKAVQTGQKGTMGFVTVDPMTSARVNYCTGYIALRPNPIYDELGIDKPFSIMSKSIGKNYIERAGWWNKENQYDYAILNGYKVRLSRYYRNKIFNYKELEDLNKIRQVESDKKCLEAYEKHGTQYGTLLYENYDQYKKSIEKKLKGKKL